MGLCGLPKQLGFVSRGHRETGFPVLLCGMKEDTLCFPTDCFIYNAHWNLGFLAA